MNAPIIEFLAGFAGSLPLLGLLLLWKDRELTRSIALLHAFCALAVSTVIMLAAGRVVLDPGAEAVRYLTPLSFSVIVVALTLNRLVNQPSRGSASNS